MHSSRIVKNFKLPSKSSLKLSKSFNKVSANFFAFELFQPSFQGTNVIPKLTLEVPTTRTFIQTPISRSSMFCFQCEQTDKGTGCTTVGVCGKTAETAHHQDLLIHQLKRLGSVASQLHKLGKADPEIDTFALRALFSTITNVNFDSARFVEFCSQAEKLFQRAKAVCERSGVPVTSTLVPDLNTFKLGDNQSIASLDALGQKYGIEGRKQTKGADIVGIEELITYGLKGMAAYAEHAEILGKRVPEVYGFIHEALAKMYNQTLSVPELLQLALETGKQNLTVMQALQNGHEVNFGVPSPTKVLTSSVKGKAILISGHDINDLYQLLKQTEGKGINVYTHGEMLPAHMYPKLKAFSHLKGHFGGPWQLQKIEFGAFPGPIIMTSNCMIEPRKSYKDRIYTRSIVGWPGVKHLSNTDFSSVIAQALSMDGFPSSQPETYLTTGFSAKAVQSVEKTLLEGIQKGDIKHFFFIGGCDGTEGERSYFTDLAKATPKDSLILTAGCGKYRFNRLDLGSIGAIPRVLDVGQCNDSYGGIQIALNLAEKLKVPFKDLPLSFAVSWFEAKSVAVCLSLLYLNVQNIRMGPRLPAFWTPNMLKLFQENYKVKLIENVEKDLPKMLQNQ